MEEQEKSKQSRGTNFVAYILSRMEESSAVGAALRKADNPSTEYQSWEYLANWCDLSNSNERACFATIASGVARAKKNNSEVTSIGRTIAYCYPDGNQDESAKRKLRRLLACDNAVEACQWCRPIIRLAESRGVSMNFGKLLDDLLYFGSRAKERWAMDFYSKAKEEKNDSNDA